jgi:uncharacterized glyoxalase superfamily protein PhnB
MPKFQPPGWHTVTPRIVVPDHQRFVQFLHDVFHAYGKARPNAPTELRIGDSLILISEGGGLRESMPAFLYVYVEDTDATYTRAITAGAVSLEPPSEMHHGDRRAMVKDPWGNLWQIATHRHAPANQPS